MEDGIPSQEDEYNGIPISEEEYDGIPMGARIPELKKKLMQFERRKARPTTRQKIDFLPNTRF